ncbi:2-dehydro-3-deoxyphosphogluconate aldolase/(4S)-4-hydroxy-2-oxoglutarate aldolase [Silvibacterium bohemicum]|uniref:2-dehydro-3-deoxyphosphogluconate aldolase/(4S)-4-hydroxy-2-oxoglutarate aldolase n=1 Tax=Silvibacterium bohemicum TaxID=1577686 RepID=A0A841K4P0_9BACT|nr:bifunctional 4-hydroxy-2-oxoglutarate aldolase/2-dehydro-3-deoxy-phosphogluconate aldolase [Silvibacterium bohemicum]MBB6145224.1 2-dehydro-3-deoxyphosphogluconate aldolase/(4S)-4-hydroxy-2-oxoglutarate aldolase [Silvibacterium bohemicum]
MTKTKKQEVIDRILKDGVVPVLRAESPEIALQAVEALRAGGIGVLEITMTVPGAVKLIERLSRDIGEECLIGAGTVLDVKAAKDCVAAGARFIVSPAVNVATIQYCRDNEIPILPGAFTPTEIVTAWTAGADAVKLFPAGAGGGPGYLKSLRAPLPDVKFVPTGGVSLDNAGEYIRAGAVAIGIGADLVNTKAISAGKAHIITEQAKLYLAAVSEARSGN